MERGGERDEKREIMGEREGEREGRREREGEGEGERERDRETIKGSSMSRQEKQLRTVFSWLHAFRQELVMLFSEKVVV